MLRELDTEDMMRRRNRMSEEELRFMLTAAEQAGKCFSRTDPRDAYR
jgi:hypothetical protein